MVLVNIDQYPIVHLKYRALSEKFSSPYWSDMHKRRIRVALSRESIRILKLSFRVVVAILCLENNAFVFLRKNID